MKVFIGIIFLALAATATYADVSSPEDFSVFDYHRKVGIPEAIRIKKLEDEAIKAGTTDAQRIVGGSLVDISLVPYQVGLVATVLLIFTSICGGSLISHNRVLTAAHCQSDGIISVNSFTVVLGSNFLFSGGERIPTTDFSIHPNWNPRTIANDIALLRISSVTFTFVIQPIALPSGNEISQDFASEIATASGFGLTSDGGNIGLTQRISWVNLPVITNAECEAVYAEYVRETNICTSGENGRGTCQGDSGGPLVVERDGRKILIGITSYGARIGCEAGFPAAYTRVTSYIPWIYSIA